MNRWDTNQPAKFVARQIVPIRARAIALDFLRPYPADITVSRALKLACTGGLVRLWQYGRQYYGIIFSNIGGDKRRELLQTLRQAIYDEIERYELS